jgi:hypothetical protein
MDGQEVAVRRGHRLRERPIRRRQSKARAVRPGGYEGRRRRRRVDGDDVWPVINHYPLPKLPRPAIPDLPQFDPLARLEALSH